MSTSCFKLTIGHRIFQSNCRNRKCKDTYTSYINTAANFHSPQLEFVSRLAETAAMITHSPGWLLRSVSLLINTSESFDNLGLDNVINTAPVLFAIYAMNV